MAGFRPGSKLGLFGNLESIFSIFMSSFNSFVWVLDDTLRYSDMNSSDDC